MKCHFRYHKDLQIVFWLSITRPRQKVGFISDMCSLFCWLYNWLRKRTSSMPFAVFMIWQEPKDHNQDCHYCLVNVKEFFSKSKSAHSSLDSAKRPVPHDASMLVLLPPHKGLESVPDEVDNSAGEGSFTDPSDSAESKYEPEKSFILILFSQITTLSELFLFKEKSKLLALK